MGYKIKDGKVVRTVNRLAPALSFPMTLSAISPKSCARSSGYLLTARPAGCVSGGL